MQLGLNEVARVDGVVWGLVFINANTLIFTVRRDDLMLLELNTRTTQKILDTPTVHRVIAQSPDGRRYLATGSGRIVRIK